MQSTQYYTTDIAQYEHINYTVQWLSSSITHLGYKMGFENCKFCAVFHHLLISVLLGSGVQVSSLLGFGLVGKDLLGSGLLYYVLLDSGHLTPQLSSAWVPFLGTVFFN